MRTSLFIILALAACSSDPAVTVDAKPQIDAAAVDAPPTAVTLDCPSYCTQIAANCTGANSQYSDSAHCLATCAKFPPGAAVTETSGNTLGCRIYHSGAPSVMTPATHCPHAGPGGGLIGALMAGAEDTHCSSPCVNFCTLNLAVCGTTGANSQYADMTACKTACDGFDRTVPYSATSTMGNTLACRMYHLTNAAISDMNAMTHCPHTGGTAAMPPAAQCK